MFGADTTHNITNRFMLNHIGIIIYTYTLLHYTYIYLLRYTCLGACIINAPRRGKCVRLIAIRRYMGIVYYNIYQPDELTQSSLLATPPYIHIYVASRKQGARDEEQLGAHHAEILYSSIEYIIIIYICVYNNMLLYICIY